MAYHVRILPRAKHDLKSILGYINAQDSPAAEKWFGRLAAAIEGLSDHPQRHPSTPENPSLRHLLFGNKPHIYRVIYLIVESAGRVDVLTIRHGAQNPFSGKAF